MRSSSLVFAALPAIWLTVGLAQEPTEENLRELLCEQCPFDAPIRIRRDDFSSPSSTPVITAEEMRALGVVSVADMINQLPQPSEQDAAPSPEDIENGADEQAAEPEETEPSSSDE